MAHRSARTTRGPLRPMLCLAPSDAGALRLGLLALVCGLLPRCCECRPGYVGLIPNGDKVPGTRKPMATGHVNTQGHGERNQFGIDFEAAGLKWTPEFCRQDSDGDGRSNGEELGDPDCVWKSAKKGKSVPPARSTGITNPGLADNLGFVALVEDLLQRALAFVQGLFGGNGNGEL
eukprot:CAMPEP_0183558172 /NCGR_PEP_ID=MMETSP0371-20130417/87768_1 /TAXON_ID=268820 /ORGANISM="Peridinium aciculiferum, Strain PAER-2" /LENGTH=175 /DNA_ID=CAMNT_0025765467 /DNA_START=36 /DNA_END=563 /DNA_ORIENTATION=+